MTADTATSGPPAHRAAGGQRPLTVSVIVPTFRRPSDLCRCLTALSHQTEPADEVVVVVRAIDSQSAAVVDDFRARGFAARTVPVTHPGQVAALNAGLAAAAGEVLAVTDDDAAPRPDWVRRIRQHFADPCVGGVGGRDWVHHGGAVETGRRSVVGAMSWFGRVAGNHHLGVGPARRVDVLKGANMSYRREAVRGLSFDARLRGAGAQVHNDLAFSLGVRRTGWALIYDPAVAVDHYPAPRFDADQRGAVNTAALVDAVHNETLCVLDHVGGVARRAAFFSWALLVGTRSSFGALQCLRFFPMLGPVAIRRFAASVAGRCLGYITWRRSA